VSNAQENDGWSDCCLDAWLIIWIVDGDSCFFKKKKHVERMIMKRDSLLSSAVVNKCCLCS
jgi:hypothetical protein